MEHCSLNQCIHGFKAFSWANNSSNLRVFISCDCAPEPGTFMPDVYDVEVRTTQHPILYHTGNFHEARFLWSDAALQMCLDRLVNSGHVVCEYTSHGLRFGLVGG